MTNAAAAPVPRNPRYASLDFWRGVACLMVVVYHASYYASEKPEALGPMEDALFGCISYFWLGVPIFFVISGYCISAACDSMRRGQRSIGEYLFRRYRRIFPPYWICAALSAAAVLAAAATGQGDLFADSRHPIALPQQLTAPQWLGNLTLTESFRDAFFGEESRYFLGHAWSLCYEEQFYLICGLLLAISRRRFFLGAGILSALVFAAGIVNALFGVRDSGFFFDGRWLMFALGILVYWTLNYAEGRSRTLVPLAVTALGIGSLAVLVYPATRTMLPDGVAFSVLAAPVFAAILLLLHRWDHRLTRSRALRPITWCGTMCYSLYLVHWPVVKPISNALWRGGIDTGALTLLVTIPVCAACSIAAARLFHLTVERRFLNAPVRPETAAISAPSRWPESSPPSPA